MGAELSRQVIGNKRTFRTSEMGRTSPSVRRPLAIRCGEATQDRYQKFEIGAKGAVPSLRPRNRPTFGAGDGARASATSYQRRLKLRG